MSEGYWNLKKAMFCTFAGCLVAVTILLQLPNLLLWLENINTFIKIIIGLMILTLAGHLFQWCCKR